jgi:hypothetical protein
MPSEDSAIIPNLSKSDFNLQADVKDIKDRYILEISEKLKFVIISF